MTRDEVRAWLDRYVAAWRTYDPTVIGALFSEDAVYRHRPYPDERLVAVGQDQIVENWLDDRDEPGTWEASYTAYAADGERAVATGTSRYLVGDGEPDRLYHNCFLLRFDSEGRCAEFTEYWMLEPKRDQR